MELKMPRGGFYVTLRCNLQCKLCAAHAPYYEKPWHPTIEELYHQVDRFFEIVDYIGHFSITGGEPLLRDDLGDVVRKLNVFSSRIGSLELFTNGTIIPNDDIMSAFKEYGGHIKFVVDNYGPNLSVNAENLAGLARRELPNAVIELRDYCTIDMHCDGWVDWGVGVNNNRTEEEAQAIFNKCSLPQKLEFVSCLNDGVIYPCPQTRRCIELGYIPFDPKEAVDLFDRSYTDAEIRQRIIDRYSLPNLRACKFCNGQCDDSIRYKPAEQLIKGAKR